MEGSPARPTDTRDVWEIGICAEYDNGDRIWCHATKEYLLEMIDEYAHLVDMEA